MEANWPAERRQELQELQTLLTEVCAINQGNHCLERIAKCINIAEKLTSTDLGRGRESFAQFLVTEATKPVPSAA